MLPLEDTFTDILSKAQRGLGLSDSDCAQLAGISEKVLVNLKTGTLDQGSLIQVARALNLHPAALLALAEGQWQPEPVACTGLVPFNSNFGVMTVNAYCIVDFSNRSAALFDTGADATPILHFLQEQEIKLESLFLTHTHGDHILELDRIIEKTGAVAFVNPLEPLEGASPLPLDRAFSIGKLTVECRLTSGHSPGGTTYLVHGLSKPVAIVGDALFAGSMGGIKIGGKAGYRGAIDRIQTQILSLPGQTILCPGHGPMTTVAEEIGHNPFFAQSV